MNHSGRLEQGFTAVELLITLIIASLFLFAGYQLYTQVTRDGSDANKTAMLSNLVYEKLNQEATATTSAAVAAAGCTSASVRDDTAAPVAVPGLGNVTYRTQVSCPNSASGTLDVFFVKVTGSYNDRGITKEVQHAAFVN